MDYLSDTSLQGLHTLSMRFLNGNLPEFIKSCAVLEEKPDAEAPLSLFGDPAGRTFPVHSKAATYLSALYLWGQEHPELKYPLEKVSARICRAGAYWGITPELTELRNIILEKTAAPERDLEDKDFALVVKYGSEKIRRFPIVSPAAIKQSAADLHRDRIQYPYAWRKQAARNILAAAMDCNVNPAGLETDHMDYLVKAAGLYPAGQDHIATQLTLRALVFPEVCRPTFRKAAGAILKGASNITKLCSLIDEADREYKRYPLYRQGLLMPEDVFFAGIPEKQAAAEPTIELTTGHRFKQSDLQRVGIEPFTVLGTDYIRDLAASDKGDLDVDKAAAILPTVPRDDAQLLEQAFAALGVTPLEAEKQASTANDWLDRDAWIRQCRGDVQDDWRLTITLRHDQDIHDQIPQGNRGKGG